MIRPYCDLGRVVVTGAQGFLGAAVVARLRAEGVTVLATGIGDAEAPCDITNFAQVEATILDGGFQTILHCGAVSGPMVLADQPLAIWAVNSQGTAHILEAARRHGINRVVVCSTREVYGANVGRVEETVLPKPASVYAAGKLAAEHAIMGYVREHGLDAVALRLSWIYGPGRRTPTILEDMLRGALAGDKVTLDAHPDEITHYLYIDDAVEGLLCAARAPALPDRIYNITAGPGIPMGSVADAVRHSLPSVRLTLAGPRRRMNGPSEIDTRRAARDLEYRPAVSLDQGLRSYVRALGG